MTISDTVMICAVFAGPITAVLITRWLDQRRQVFERRMDVFKTLMRTRRTPMVQEHVGALNLIELEFRNDPAVMASWRELFNHFGTEHVRRPNEQRVDDQTQNPERDRIFHQRLNDERQRLLAKLLHAIGKRLRFRAEQLEIFEGGYTPQGWVDLELQNDVVRRFCVDLAFGNRFLPVGIFDLGPKQPQADDSKEQQASVEARKE